jgi:predicted transcriptional regulator
MRKELNIHVGGGFDAVSKRVVDAWRRAERGEKVGERHLTFVSWATLAKVMTPKRFELLRHLHRNPAANVASLARSLKRDYKRVFEDVGALAKAGLIERDKNGLRAEYTEMRTVIAL